MKYLLALFICLSLSCAASSKPPGYVGPGVSFMVGKTPDPKPVRVRTTMRVRLVDKTIPDFVMKPDPIPEPPRSRGIR